jgi:hypothetical protein
VSLSEQIVYAPISKLSNLELARVIHELTHFAMEVIFNNSINPYFNGNQTNYYAFQESAKSTIVSLSKIANIEFAHPDKLLKNKSVTLSDLAIALYQDKTILKYTIPERIDDHIRVNLLFYTFFSVSERYDLQKKLVNQLFIAEVHQKNISSDGLILLERIGDLVTYPKNQHDKELIARLTELQVRNISSNMLSYLAPLEKYWLDFITPVVNKIRSNNSFICHEEEIDVTGQIVQEL